MPTLNVILHGLFLVVEEPWRLVAAVPAIADHQQYRIGVESESDAKFYGRGTFELLGAESATNPAILTETQNAKVHDCEVFTTAPPARSVFIFPLPHKVFSCRCMTKGIDLVFIGNHASEIQATQFATIIVLSYFFHDINELEFVGLPVLDFHFSDETEQYVNVGIISSGAHQNSTAVSAAFDKMMADLAPSKDIHLVQINLDPNPVVSCSGIPGITAETFESLLSLQLNNSVDDCVPFAVRNVS